eukprot:scaffold4616_cov81-Isochrysis_galbana.AAC.1
MSVPVLASVGGDFSVCALGRWIRHPPPASVCLSCPPRALGRRAHPRRRFPPSSPQINSTDALQCLELTNLETLGTSRTVSVSARSQPPIHGTNPESRHGRWLRPS